MDFDAVASAARETPSFFVRRCKSPEQLIGRVREVAAANGPIDVLDIHDHGKRGHLRLGTGLLFHHEGAGLHLARALRPYLTPDARIRLLGCETAVGDEGRRLLSMLRDELGGAIVIYGTLATIVPDSFEEGVFLKSSEDVYLFSSTEAMRREAPTWEDRLAELRSWSAAHAIVLDQATPARTESRL
jgi:hypothetical protein